MRNFTTIELQLEFQAQLDKNIITYEEYIIKVNKLAK
jgi:hypothetical protein